MAILFGTHYLKHRLIDCNPSYSDSCIKSPPPKLNCPDISFRNFKVIGSDPHGFDDDKDGVGCENGEGGSSSGGSNNNNDDGASTSTNGCQGQADCFRGTVTEIVDGDTIDINNVPSTPGISQYSGERR